MTDLRGAGPAPAAVRLTVSVPYRLGRPSSRDAGTVGRDAELAELHGAVRGAAGHAGGLLFVTGESGTGKSRILDEAAEYASARGLLVLRGRCSPSSGAYRPVAQAILAAGWTLAEPELRRYRSALSAILPSAPFGGPALPVPDPELAIGEGLLAAAELHSSGSGAVLLIEDAQDADAATISLVGYLADRLPATGLLVIASIRIESAEPVDHGRFGPLLAHRAARVLPLGPLSPDAVADLAGRLAGGPALPARVVRMLQENAAGLPLLVEELVQSLLRSGSLHGDARGWQVAEDLELAVPAGLATLVGRRFGDFSPAVGELVEAAAVLGTAVDWRLLAVVSDAQLTEVEQALRVAVTAGLLEPDPASVGGLRWRHALVREAVLARVQPPRRAALAEAAAAAEWESARTATVAEARESALAQSAGFRQAAGQPHQASAVYCELARSAAARGAVGSAIGWLDRAAALGPLNPRQEIERVHLLTLTGRASAALDAGAALVHRLGGPDHADLCLELARAAVTVARWPLALEYVERSGRAGRAAAADAIAADALFGAGDIDGARALAERAVDTAGEDPMSACVALEVLGRCAARSDPEAGEAAFRRAALLAADSGLIPQRISALLGVAIMELTRLELSPALVEVGELAVDAGMLVVAVSVDVLLADSRMMIDGPAAARPVAEACAQLAARIGLGELAATALSLAAHESAAQGRTGDLAAILSAAQEAAPESTWLPVLVHFTRAMEPLLADDLAAARDLFDAGAALAEGQPSGAPLAHWGLWALVRALLDDRADAAIDRVRDSPAATRGVNRAAVLFAEAVQHGRAGRADAAAAAFAEADLLLPTQHWWRRLLRLLALHAAVADGWGEPVPLLRADLATFEAGGDALLARTARDLLRRAGVSVRRGRGDSTVPPALRAVGVTSREVEVLDLLTSGSTNADIAGRLFLSVRTVDHHVASLLAKTGTANRSELAALRRSAAGS